MQKNKDDSTTLRVLPSMLVVLNGVKGRQTIDKQIHKELSMAENEGAAVAVDNAAVPTNEWERMLSGELYICGDMQREANMRKRRWCTPSTRPHTTRSRNVTGCSANCSVHSAKARSLNRHSTAITAATRISADQLLCQYGLHLLDVARITIGDRVFFGPRVGLYTPYHPIDGRTRFRSEGARPITIGNDVWFGGSVVVCPGVTIGDDVVIGAGSVVTKDIPSHLAAGQPVPCDSQDH